MKTPVLPIDEASLARAAELLRAGEIFALPTETVYGIAADAYNSKAVQKIFTAKGRPQDNPLIVHVSGLEMAAQVAAGLNGDARKLAEAFWPGPLTMILPKGPRVCAEVCAGLDSVGVRMPAHPAAQEIIRRSGRPFAAPSANRSGRPSPTTAQDVLADMDGRLPLILDGGACPVGVESTVVSLLEETPLLLRPGYITAEQMEKVLHRHVAVSAAVLERLREGQQARSPGMKYRHYAPKAKITVLDGTLEAFRQYLQSLPDKNGAYALCFDGEEPLLPVPAVAYGGRDDPASQARRLFRSLRRLDELGAQVVYARCPGRSGVSMAVYNRLLRAAGFEEVRL